MNGPLTATSRRRRSGRLAAACLGLLGALSGCQHVEPRTEEINSYRVDSVEAFDALGLQAIDNHGRQTLTVLRSAIAQRAETSTFLLGFRRYEPRPPLAIIHDQDGLSLEAVGEARGGPEEAKKRADREGCVHTLPPSLQWLEVFLHPERYQGQQCGNIATLHSALKLGWLTEAEAFQGEFLNRDRVRALNLFHHSDTASVGMTDKELQDAHRSFTTPNRKIDCSHPLSSNTESRTIEGILRMATLLVNVRHVPMDCSLHVDGDYNANGKPRISHVEQITAMRKLANGNWEIETLDGFNQGKDDASIPKAPGKNTWEFGANTGRLKAGPRPNKSVMHQLVFKDISIVCCNVRQ